VQDPVLGNTSILNADFDVLKKYVRAFEDGIGFDRVENDTEDIVQP
jgi:hypothetical protein